MAKPEIQLEGMRELRRELRNYETETPWKGAFKNAYSAVAEPLAETIRGKAGGSRMGAKARATIKGKATTTGASISAYRGEVYKYGPGFEFGSTRYRQFPAKRKEGYHIYPTISEEREEIGERFLDALGRAFSSDFGE